MLKSLYVIRDSVSGNCSDILIVDNVPSFVRSLSLEFASSGMSPILARDAVLYHIGIFDPDKLTLEACVPTSVWKGDDPSFAEMVKVASAAFTSVASSDSEAPAAEGYL